MAVTGVEDGRGNPDEVPTMGDNVVGEGSA